MRERERLEGLPNGGEPRLGADDHHGVVLPHIASGHQRQALRARHCGHLAQGLRDHPLDHVPGRRSDEQQKIVDLAGTVQEDPLVIHEVVDLEQEPVVHLGVDDEACRVEGVGEHLVQGQVPRARLGLVAEEAQDRLGGPLFDLDGRVADVAGDRKGTLHWVVAAPNKNAFTSLVRLWDLPDTVTEQVARHVLADLVVDQRGLPEYGDGESTQDGQHHDRHLRATGTVWTTTVSVRYARARLHPTALSVA